MNIFATLNQNDLSLFVGIVVGYSRRDLGVVDVYRSGGRQVVVFRRIGCMKKWKLLSTVD